MWDKFISQFKIISNKTNKIKNKNCKITAAGELNYLLHKVPCTIVGEFFFELESIKIMSHYYIKPKLSNLNNSLYFSGKFEFTEKRQTTF